MLSTVRGGAAKPALLEDDNGGRAVKFRVETIVGIEIGRVRLRLYGDREIRSYAPTAFFCSTATWAAWM